MTVSFKHAVLNVTDSVKPDCTDIMDQATCNMHAKNDSWCARTGGMHAAPRLVGVVVAVACAACPPLVNNLAYSASVNTHVL